MPTPSFGTNTGDPTPSLNRPPLVVPNPFFGGSGAASSSPAASRILEQDFRHPDLHHPALAGRFASTDRANRLTLPAKTVVRWHADRPFVLSAISAPTGLIYYQAARAPRWTSTSLPLTDADDAPLVSTGPGVCYLYTAGDWFLFANQSTALEVMLVDASDPGVLSRYLSEPGAVRQTAAITSQKFDLAAGVTQTIAANRWRRFLIVQNVTGSAVAVRLCFGDTTGFDTTAPTGYASAGNGLYLSNGASITLAGETLWKGSLTLGAPVNAQVVWSEGE